MVEPLERDDEPIRIASYDAGWPTRFEQELAALENVIEWATGGIHHVGSTAVNQGSTQSRSSTSWWASPTWNARAHASLRSPASECVYAPYRPDEMLWFCKPSPSHRTHHLHLVPTDSDRFRAELAFRDHLRSHSEVAAEYAALKRRLAAQFEHDREAYTEAKGAFVNGVLRRGR